MAGETWQAQCADCEQNVERHFVLQKGVFAEDARRGAGGMVELTEACVRRKRNRLLAAARFALEIAHIAATMKRRRAKIHCHGRL
jgi:hypothetical protein